MIEGQELPQTHPFDPHERSEAQDGKDNPPPDQYTSFHKTDEHIFAPCYITLSKLNASWSSRKDRGDEPKAILREAICSKSKCFPSSFRPPFG
jgi:hypothetical protein